MCRNRPCTILCVRDDTLYTTDLYVTGASRRNWQFSHCRSIVFVLFRRYSTHQPACMKCTHCIRGVNIFYLDLIEILQLMRPLVSLTATLSCTVVVTLWLCKNYTRFCMEPVARYHPVTRGGRVGTRRYYRHNFINNQLLRNNNTHIWLNSS